MLMSGVKKYSGFMRVTGFCLALLLALGSAPAMAGHDESGFAGGLTAADSMHANHDDAHKGCDHCTNHQEDCKDGVICASMCPSSYASNSQSQQLSAGINPFPVTYKSEFQSAFPTRFQKVPVDPPRV